MDGEASGRGGGAKGWRQRESGSGKTVKRGRATRGAKRGKASRSGRLAGTVSKTLLGGRQGSAVCAAVVVVGEQIGDHVDEVSSRCEVAGGAPTGRSGRGGRAVGGERQKTRPGRGLSAASCQTLAAVSHVVRARILAKLLEGPAVYRSLQRMTKLKAGPLYHHVNQLRLAGLIMPKQRDLYELTRGGRNLILALTAVAPLIRDRRRRPHPRGGR